MVEVIDDDFMVCTDCLMIIANDDASGLDYSLGEEEAAAREQEIRGAIAEIQREERQIVVGDSDRDEEFSSGVLLASLRLLWRPTGWSTTPLRDPGQRPGALNSRCRLVTCRPWSWRCRTRHPGRTGCPETDRSASGRGARRL